MNRFVRTPIQVLLLVWLALASITALDTWRHSRARRPGWLHRVAFHGGIDDRVQAMDVAGGRLLAVTGGVKLDLRQANPVGEGVDLRVAALMGGVAIIIPEGWRVELQASAYLGGVANHTNGGNGPILRLDALAVMGGVYVGHTDPTEEAHLAE